MTLRNFVACLGIGAAVALAGACSSSSSSQPSGNGGGGGGGGGSGDGGGGGGGGGSSNDHEGEQSNGACPSSPVLLKGTASDGASCSAATDCAPTCCSCSNGDGDQWLAAECVNGKCSQSGACTDTASSDYCP